MKKALLCAAVTAAAIPIAALPGTAAASPVAALTVVFSGSGSGYISSADGGIDCGDFCTSYSIAGTVITLSAAPAAGSTFVGWGGACSGTGNCTVSPDGATKVEARFDRPATLAATPAPAQLAPDPEPDNPVQPAAAAQPAQSLQQASVTPHKAHTRPSAAKSHARGSKRR